MQARWPRALVALFLASSAGALGAAALFAGPAGAATDANGCGSSACAPVVVVGAMQPDGSVTVTYTDPVNPLVEVLDSKSPSLTVTWAPPVTAPVRGAAQPSAPGFFKLTTADGNCTGSGPITCIYPFPDALKVNGFALNGTYQLQASARDCLALGLGTCTAAPPSPNPPMTGTLTNAPSTPTGANAVLVPAGVKISWTPSPEPDIAGYQAIRNDTGNSVGCQLDTSPATTDFSCVDSTSGGGNFAYHVVAYRWGATYDAKPQASAPSALSPSVTVPGPPATTTTTVRGATTTLPAFGGPGFGAKPAPGKSTGLGGTGTFHASPGSASAPAAVTPGGEPAVGGSGFLPNLPYGQTTTTSPSDQSALSAPPAAHKGKTSVGTIAVIGAGLLIAVIALHGLWLRSEVRRAGTLEALDPEV